VDGLSMGEVERRTGLRASAVRYYESMGLLSPPARVAGRRRFDSGVVDRLRVISMAAGLGFSLDEIRTLLDGFREGTPPPERWRALAREKLPAVDEQIRRATALKRLLEFGLACRCVRVEDCFLNDCAGTVAIRAAPRPPSASAG
jgi:MerR family transcriptional regulator, redox-sensitive transcriptional activator SoxR